MAELGYRGIAPGGPRALQVLDRFECEAWSYEVELDEERASEEDDSINGDARNVNKGHGMVETNNVTFRY